MDKNIKAALVFFKTIFIPFVRANILMVLWCWLIFGVLLSVVVALLGNAASATLIFASFLAIFFIANPRELVKIGVLGVTAEYRTKVDLEVDRVRSLVEVLSVNIDSFYCSGKYLQSDGKYLAQKYFELCQIIGREGEVFVGVRFLPGMSEILFRRVWTLGVHRIKSFVEDEVERIRAEYGEEVNVGWKYPSGFSFYRALRFEIYQRPPVYSKNFDSIADEYVKKMDIFDDLYFSDGFKERVKQEIVSHVLEVEMAFRNSDLRSLVEKSILLRPYVFPVRADD